MECPSSYDAYAQPVGTEGRLVSDLLPISFLLLSCLWRPPKPRWQESSLLELWPWHCIVL